MKAPGIWEILLILLVIIIVFGAGKLPDVGRQLGRGIRDFKKFSAGSEDAVTKSSDSGQTATPLSELEITKAKLEAAEAKLKLKSLEEPTKKTTG